MTLDNFEDEMRWGRDLTGAFFGFVFLLSLTLAVEQARWRERGWKKVNFPER